MRLDSGNFSFQSTLPAWGETTVRTTDDYCYGFQSTLPAWGETRPAPGLPARPTISIHSPRMGRDAISSEPASPAQFQSTLPAWGETGGGVCRRPPAAVFQSTLPAWGETQSDIETYVATLISIHSPRMGRDDLVVQVDLRPDDFNPLSPHGERRAGRIRLSVEKHFNPLSPHGERPLPPPPHWHLP